MAYYFPPKQKPQRWGTPQDIEFAVAKNSEKIYGIDHKSNVLVMPLFFGFPCLDFSGKQNHGTPVGGVVYDGQGLDFDGSTGYVDCGNNANLKPSLPVTISTRIKSDDTGNIKNILATDSWDPNYYGFHAQKNNIDKIVVMFGDGDVIGIANRRTKVGNTTLKVGDIYQIVAVISGATDMQIYINSVDDGGTYSGTGGALAYSSATAKIGYNLATFWNGLIPEARINNIALTAEQIALFYARPWDLYRRVGRTYYSVAAGGGVAPTSTIYGSLWGPFAGPI